MIASKKDDWLIAIAFGFALVAVSFASGVYAGLDQAMEAQLREERLSVYCQQVGAIETLCADLKGE